MQAHNIFSLANSKVARSLLQKYAVLRIMQIMSGILSCVTALSSLHARALGQDKPKLTHLLSPSSRSTLSPVWHMTYLYISGKDESGTRTCKPEISWFVTQPYSSTQCLLCIRSLQSKVLWLSTNHWSVKVHDARPRTGYWWQQAKLVLTY